MGISPPEGVAVDATEHGTFYTDSAMISSFVPCRGGQQHLPVLVSIVITFITVIMDILAIMNIIVIIIIIVIIPERK